MNSCISQQFPLIIFFSFLLPLQQQWIDKAWAAVDREQRVDCLPSRFPLDKKEDCIKVGCIWDDDWDKYRSDIPLCYIPPEQGYKVEHQWNDGKGISLKWDSKKKLKNPYSDPNLDIQVEVKEMDGGAIALKIGRDGRFVPPVPLNNKPQFGSNEKLNFKCTNEQTFAFNVIRDSDSQIIWDTSIGGFLFGDQFIQIASFLPTDRIYGFGENLHHQLKHDFGVYKTWGMFSRDQPEDAYTPGSANEYGVHPFYIGLEPSGKVHGVFIFNSNAQELTTGPGPHLIYRTIGGQLELFFFPGPTPEEVTRQYQELIGRPYLPAYWALGFQICRYGYTSVKDVREVVERTRKAEIPFDVQYADINYMERYKDFTYDSVQWEGFPEFVEELHKMGMKLVLIFDPPVQVNYSVFQRGLEQGASFVEWPSKEMVQKENNDLYNETRGTKMMLGVQWADYHVAYPDFLDPSGNTNRWWADEFARFRKEIPFDGIWIDMNEPSAFGTNENQPWYFRPDSFVDGKPPIKPLWCPAQSNKWDWPPYRTCNVDQWDTAGKIPLSQNTLCMIGQTGRGRWRVYDTHSLYGWSETVATQQAIRSATGKRGTVISRSTFPSSGHYGGHWLGDNVSRWPDLRLSIIGIQEFNMFGIPQIGADVCGFIGNTTEELCLRWQQLGAFYSYYRNHNDINSAVPQDPALWDSVAKATKAANLFRYRHLPYLYTLHFLASKEGGTVVRPLFFEFPSDANTHSMSFQFMWGPAMLIVPVLSPNVKIVRGYLPPHDQWYSMSDAHKYGQIIAGGYSNFNAPRDTALPVFLRAGHIIPRQAPALTTDDSRKNPFQLLVGLKSNSTAQGRLLWDDGETIVDNFDTHPYYEFHFSAHSNEKKTVLILKRVHASSKEKLPTLNQIEIFGHLFQPNLESIELNDQPMKLKAGESFYDPNTCLLRIERNGNGLLELDDRPDHWKFTWKNLGGDGHGSNGANAAENFAVAWILLFIFYGIMIFP